MAENVTQTTITQAPEYLQPGIEKFLDLSAAQAGDAIDTSKFAPSVVGLGALQQQAQQQAATQAGLGTLQFDPTTGAVSGVSGQGVAGFQPFLQAAQDLTSPTAFQQFESPYQQAVRDATLQAFDEQAAGRQQQIADSAVAMGAFGGGREGVQLANYQTGSDRNRAALQANLLSQGFTQAQNLRQQALQNQLNFASQGQQFRGQDIAALSTMGALNQAQRQAALTAQQQLLQKQLMQPLTAAQTYGSGVTSLIAGYPGQTSQITAPGPSPINTALGAGTTLAGIYRAFNPQPQNFTFQQA